MPGVPLVTDPNYPVFWMSFWAALYSGVLYSIVTGVIVGLAVWRIQVSAERRKTEREGEREVALLKAKLRTALEQPKTTSITSAVNTLPNAATPLNALIANGPLDMWEDNLQAHRSFFQLLRAFSRAHSDFMVVARKLDYALRRTTRWLNASRGLMEFHDPPRIMFFVGRLVGFDPPALMPWLESPTDVTVGEYEEDRAATADDPQVAELSGPFLEARSALIGCIEAIGQAIDKAQA